MPCDAGVVDLPMRNRFVEAQAIDTSDWPPWPFRCSGYAAIFMKTTGHAVERLRGKRAPWQRSSGAHQRFQQTGLAMIEYRRGSSRICSGSLGGADELGESCVRKVAIGRLRMLRSLCTLQSTDETGHSIPRSGIARATRNLALAYTLTHAAFGTWSEVAPAAGRRARLAKPLTYAESLDRATETMLSHVCWARLACREPTQRRRATRSALARLYRRPWPRGLVSLRLGRVPSPTGRMRAANLVSHATFDQPPFGSDVGARGANSDCAMPCTSGLAWSFLAIRPARFCWFTIPPQRHGVCAHCLRSRAQHSNFMAGRTRAVSHLCRTSSLSDPSERAGDVRGTRIRRDRGRRVLSDASSEVLTHFFSLDRRRLVCLYRRRTRTRCELVT